MGVQEDIDRCLELVEGEDDEVERVLRLLDDVGYIRQPAAIKYLRRYLNSEGRLPPQSGPSDPGQKYASFVMSILADCLSNYPVKKDEGHSYKQEEIDLCRQWMAQQTSWKIRR